MSDSYDLPISEIASYVVKDIEFSENAMETAILALFDSLGCAILALQFPACKKLIGPLIEGTLVPKGSRVIGTKFILDPISAAFQNGLLIRWLDFNDTFLAKEWGHPSDNLGALLSLSDHLSQKQGFTVFELLKGMIKAYEIQGVLALETSYNKIGIDHVALVKIASAAVSAKMLGLNEDQIAAAVSNAFIDSAPLRTYRHEPNTGSRKSWAAGDASSKGLFLSYLALKGEMGYKTCITAPKFGLADVLFSGKPPQLGRELGSYVMENLLFKVSFPAEFHAQTAVEAGIKLHSKVKDHFFDIEKITIETQASGFRIINKKGPFKNPADRDHSLQYMTAVALLKGSLEATDYEDEHEKNPLIRELIQKMEVLENSDFSKDYLDPTLRSISNAITITFKNGQGPEYSRVDFPLGHKFRRKEATQAIFTKFERNTSNGLPKQKEIIELFKNSDKLKQLQVSELIYYFISSVI